MTTSLVSGRHHRHCPSISLRTGSIMLWREWGRYEGPRVRREDGGTDEEEYCRAEKVEVTSSQERMVVRMKKWTAERHE